MNLSHKGIRRQLDRSKLSVELAILAGYSVCRELKLILSANKEPGKTNRLRLNKFVELKSIGARGRGQLVKYNP